MFVKLDDKAPEFINTKNLKLICITTENYMMTGELRMRKISELNLKAIEKILGDSSFIKICDYQNYIYIINKTSINCIEQCPSGNIKVIIGIMSLILTVMLEDCISSLEGSSGHPEKRTTNTIRVSLPMNKTHLLLGLKNVPKEQAVHISQINISEISVKVSYKVGNHWGSVPLTYKEIDNGCYHVWEAQCQLTWFSRNKYNHQLEYGGTEIEYYVSDGSSLCLENEFTIEYL